MLNSLASESKSIVSAGWLEFGSPSGPPIIALHGFPQTAESWVQVAERLAEIGYRVIMPRQRGYTVGFRPQGRLKYTVPRLSNDVIRLMDHLGINRAHVAGHDLGAGVAWDLAAWRPERIAAVISLAFPHPGGFLIDVCTSLHEAVKAWYFVLAQLPAIPEILFSPSRKASRRRFERFLALKGLGRETAAKYLDQLSEDSLFTSAVNWYRAMPFVPIRRVLGKAKVPALIIWGDGDSFTSRRSVELSARFTESWFRIEEIPRGSHWLLDDRPDEVAKLISARLADWQESSGKESWGWD